MMKVTKSLFACLTLCCAALTISAKEYKDTVYTHAKDRIIITYEVQNSEGKSTVRFQSVQKKLSSASQKQYKDLEKVAVMFFDRVAGTDIKIENMTPQAFIVPAGATYEDSEEGYFIVQDNPAISFRLKTQDKVKLALPLYLAYHEKKNRYKLFAKAEDLIIKLNASTGSGSGGGARGGAAASARDGEPRAANADDLVETFTTEEEDGQNDQMLKVLGLRGDIMTMVDQMNEDGGLDETDQAELRDLVKELRKLKYEIQDEEAVKLIEETLDAYSKASKSAKANAAAGAAADAAAAEAKAKAEKAEQDSIAKQEKLAKEEKEKKEKEESEKKTLWMILGGIGLGVVAFIGNMIFKNIQRKKQQLSMENMTKRMQQEAQKKAAAATQEAMKQAETKAKEAALQAAKNAQQPAQQQTPQQPATTEAADPKPASIPAAPVASASPANSTSPVTPDNRIIPGVNAPAAPVAENPVQADATPARPARRKFSDLMTGTGNASTAASTAAEGKATGTSAASPQTPRKIGNYKVAPRRPRPDSGESK